MTEADAYDSEDVIVLGDVEFSEIIHALQRQGLELLMSVRRTPQNIGTVNISTNVSALGH